MIQGETGTGKELVAHAIHAGSSRADKPMVYVNCAALPESIAESELFGHVKGAFTGATSNRAGKFELADGGTIFLDEIGELPLLLQAKLLRVIQQGEVQRVGADQNLHIDVRIVAATNRDLKQEVENGQFRSDLYHRLNVFPIRFLPFDPAKATFLCWPVTSWIKFAISSTQAGFTFTLLPSPGWRDSPGRAMCVSWSIP